MGNEVCILSANDDGSNYGREGGFVNIKTLRKWEMVGIYDHYHTPRSFLKSIELERELGSCSVLFEVTVKQWTEDAQFPEIESVSGLSAFNAGGQEITNPATLNTLQTLAEGYCRENMDEIIEMINKREEK